MAGFCSNCGFPLGASVAFCSKCGARQANSPAETRPITGSPQAVAPTAAPAKSGSGFKILMVVVVCFALFGAIAIGGVWYAAHRVKQAVVQTAQNYGVDLTPITQASSSGSSSHTSQIRSTCDALSKSEASDLLGEPIERTVPDGESCQYFGAPGRAAKLAQEYASKVVPKKGQEPDIAQIMGQLQGATSGVTNDGKDAPMLTIALDLTNGKSQYVALTATKALFSGIPGGAMGQEVPNLGDRAIRLANLGLNVLKGEAMLRVVPGPVPARDEKEIAIAQKILPRI
jgi:hypothetical protein